MLKALVLIFLLLLSSCNSSNKRNSSSINGGNGAEAPKTSEKEVIEVQENNSDTIVIKGMEFSPRDYTAKKGATVVWINKDIVVHDVTEYPEKSWTSGALSPGESWSKQVDEGFDYFCSIHITMKGKVSIEP